MNLALVEAERNTNIAALENKADEEAAAISQVCKRIAMPNLFTDIPDELPQELIQALLKLPTVRIERIASKGHFSPIDFWYDQDENEWLLLVSGAARLQFEDRIVDLKPGDFINIPAQTRHRVEWTDPDQTTIWLAVFYA